jgi:hypothetical protein
MPKHVETLLLLWAIMHPLRNSLEERSYHFLRCRSFKSRVSSFFLLRFVLFVSLFYSLCTCFNSFFISLSLFVSFIYLLSFICFFLCLFLCSSYQFLFCSGVPFSFPLSVVSSFFIYFLWHFLFIPSFWSCWSVSFVPYSWYISSQYTLSLQATQRRLMLSSMCHFS